MPAHVPRPAAGFTLVELMIVVAIAGILAAIAYPSFMSQLRSSRRTDAVLAITAVQQAQERRRANNATYTNDLAALGVRDLQTITSTTPHTYLSANGHYGITLSNNTATGYTVTATAVSGSSQARDTGCTTIAVVMSNGTATPSQPACWRQ